jgi:hypothetical protein
MKTCLRDGCEFPPMKGKRKCSWHYGSEQPIEVQVRAAERRLARVPAAQRRPRVPAAQWPAGTRWCAGCQSMIPLWYASGSRCRACASKAAHRAAVAKTYGLEDGEFEAIWDAQGRRCPICLQIPRAKRPAVDHDHDSGAVRGLLCQRCNHELLGAAHDDVEILRRAVAYLERPPAYAVLGRS